MTVQNTDEGNEDRWRMAVGEEAIIEWRLVTGDRRSGKKPLTLRRSRKTNVILNGVKDLDSSLLYRRLITLLVLLVPVDLPAGQTLPYKDIPVELIVESEAGVKTPMTIRSDDNATRNLALGFEVQDSATGFTPQWPGNDAVALTIAR